jgi:hypothetical protein
LPALAQPYERLHHALFRQVDGREQVLMMLGDVDLALTGQLHHHVARKAFLTLAGRQLYLDTVEIMRVGVLLDGIEEATLHMIANALGEAEMTCG